jgi:hypothetical protein
MGSGSMIHTPSFLKTASPIGKLVGGDTQTHRQHADRISLFSGIQNKGSRLENHSNYFVRPEVPSAVFEGHCLQRYGLENRD